METQATYSATAIDSLTLTQRIRRNAEDMSATLTVAQKASAAYSEAEYLLACRRAHVITDGQIVGKNESERAACERTVLAWEYSTLHQAAQDKQAAQLHLDIARTEQRALDMELRALDLERAAGSIGF